MKTINNQDFKSSYATLFYIDVQQLVDIRKNMRITQSDIAFFSKVSLRTIQNFESYKSQNDYLRYVYTEILK